MRVPQCRRRRHRLRALRLVARRPSQPAELQLQLQLQERYRRMQRAAARMDIPAKALRLEIAVVSMGGVVRLQLIVGLVVRSNLGPVLCPLHPRR